jgi:hypothetical protein
LKQEDHPRSSLIESVGKKFQETETETETETDTNTKKEAPCGKEASLRENV